MVERDSEDADTASGAVDPLLGKVLHGRFTVLEPIGTGGMGRVYKALQAPLDRLVALKILNPHYQASKDPGFQKRFFLEAAMTAKLRHPNTITIIDYGKTEDGIFYIAMEYVEGQTLGQLLTQGGAIAWPRVLHIAQQICRSLREAHRAGIVHRDLKPANVMLLHEETDHDQVKVLDFGLVKSFLAVRKRGEAELTQSGVLLGSPQYMAPEQAKGQADPRSDVYSLGVMMYQMLSGKPPFVGRESIEVIVKHVREPVPPLRPPRPELEFPAEVSAVVLRCLEKDPDARYQSMDELLEALRRAGVNGGLAGSFADPRSQPISSPKAPVARRATRSLRKVVIAAPALEGEVTDTDVEDPPSAARRWPWVLAAASALLLGVMVADRLRSRSSLPAPVATPLPTPAPVAMPAPVPTPVEVEPSEPPARAAPARPSLVRFEVESEPPGASVSLGGAPVGRTPLTLSVMPGAGGLATADLTFTLEGYLPVTVTARGEGPTVHHHQPLTRRPSRKPRPKPRPQEGYKDDPYQ